MQVRDAAEPCKNWGARGNLTQHALTSRKLVTSSWTGRTDSGSCDHSRHQDISTLYLVARWYVAVLCPRIMREIVDFVRYEWRRDMRDVNYCPDYPDIRECPLCIHPPAGDC
ncbi:uncharacterized protein BO97DRAFT_59130 [Aspergillus homomorphus CBS 101889]|uniref:Uncharacterized protein n=1 Tax=Aspergillus homomorphus (strain CBS 101889) TaxID=1450537 RepID=A0A395I1U6_ASPHC|nr:hypothetical protein BO97DRAFT_59130 [Aspergillus homomorphus CBS 101889]RAL12534.1 hypothetical protein BO97DRAFT_59130 [Aspergillus homomorphus CBS 101889]